MAISFTHKLMKARKAKLPVCWAPWFTHRTLPTAWPSGTTWLGPTWAPWRSNCATKNQMSTTRCCGAWAGTKQTTGRKDVFFCTSLWNTTRWAWLFLPEPPWPRQAGRVLYTAVKGVLRDLCGQYYTCRWGMLAMTNNNEIFQGISDYCDANTFLSDTK